jgi:hypothetical protein
MACRFLTCMIATRSGIISSVSSSRPHGRPSTYDRMLPYRSIPKNEARGFGTLLSPVYYRREITRPVSYYALFK